MTVPIRLFPFDNQNTEKHPMKQSKISVILGSVGAGKSTILLSILNEISNDTWNRAIIFSANKLDAKLVDNISDDVELYGCDSDKLHQIIAEIRQEALASKRNKKPIPKILFVLDDCAGDSAFFSSNKTAFNSFILSIRHFSVTLILTSQRLKLVNPSVRVNASVWYISRLAPEEKRQLFRELPFPNAVLDKAYDIATAQPFDWLQINIPKKLLIKNFAEIIDV